MRTTIDLQIEAVKKAIYLSKEGGYPLTEELNDVLSSLTTLKLVPKPRAETMDATSMALLESLADGNTVELRLDTQQNVRLEIKRDNSRVSVVVDRFQVQAIYLPLSEASTLLNNQLRNEKVNP